MRNVITENNKRLYSAIGAVLGWFAIILQCYLMLHNRTAAIPETLIRFFGFFTILTNILVAVCFAILAVKPIDKRGPFFARPSTVTALTVFIAVVGIVYNVILRFLWSPQGLQFIVDELLHSVMPVLFIVYWFIFVPKQSLKWKNILPWLIYPTAYCIYSLVRGAMVNWYPYPFLDVNILGYNKVLFNIVGMMILFVIIALLLVGIAKQITNRSAGKIL